MPLAADWRQSGSLFYSEQWHGRDSIHVTVSRGSSSGMFHALL